MGILIRSESNNHLGKYVTKHWHGPWQVCGQVTYQMVKDLRDGECACGGLFGSFCFSWVGLGAFNSVQFIFWFLVEADSEDGTSNVFSLCLWSSSTQRTMTEMWGMVRIRRKVYRSRGVIKGTDEAVGGRQLGCVPLTVDQINSSIIHIRHCAKPGKWE